MGSGRPVPEAGYGEHLAADLAAPLVRLDTARHFVPEDHPEPVAAAVHEVLAAIDTRRWPPAGRSSAFK